MNLAKQKTPKITIFDCIRYNQEGRSGKGQANLKEDFFNNWCSIEEFCI
jgi:hypothetical protein